MLGQPPEAGRRKEQIRSQHPIESASLPDSSLLNCERINFYCFKPSGLWPFVKMTSRHKHTLQSKRNLPSFFSHGTHSVALNCQHKLLFPVNLSLVPSESTFNVMTSQFGKINNLLYAEIITTKILNFFLVVHQFKYLLSPTRHINIHITFFYFNVIF